MAICPTPPGTGVTAESGFGRSVETDFSGQPRLSATGTHIDDDRARLDVRCTDEIMNACRHDDDIGRASHLGEIASSRMRSGERGVLLDRHPSQRSTDQLGAPHDNGSNTDKVDLDLLEEGDDTRSGAGTQPSPIARLHADAGRGQSVDDPIPRGPPALTESRHLLPTQLSDAEASPTRMVASPTGGPTSRRKAAMS